MSLKSIMYWAILQQITYYSAYSVQTLYKCYCSFVLPFLSFVCMGVIILVFPKFWHLQCTLDNFAAYVYIDLYLIFYHKIKNIDEITPEENIFSGREGTFGCLLHYYPKFYNNVFIFVGLITLGTFIEFWLVY